MNDIVTQMNILMIKLILISLLSLLIVATIRYTPSIFRSLKNANLKFTKQEKAHGIVLGRLGKYILYSPIYEEGHAIVLGSSGSAKTTSILLPTLYSWNQGFFTIDISGDISNNISNNNLLFPSLIYDPLQADSNVVYNPFWKLDKLKNRDLINEELTKIAYILLPDKSQSDTTKWFDDGGRSILVAALICFYHNGFDFIDICHEITDNDYQRLFNTIDQNNNEAAIKEINQFAGMSEKNISGCMQSAQSAVKLFTSPIISRKISRHIHYGEAKLTPESIESNRIFFRIPDSKKEVYAPLIELVVSQLLDYISDRPDENIKNKVLIAIDEYASFKRLDLSQPLAKSRKKGCRIMILCQNLNQISRNFGEYAMKEIVDNCDLNIICRISEPSSQRYFSEKAGCRNTNPDNLNKPIFKPETFGKLHHTNIILARGEHFRVLKNYYWKYY